jgi:hypothetical protein
MKRTRNLKRQRKTPNQLVVAKLRRTNLSLMLLEKGASLSKQSRILTLASWKS